jgi:hypothetical protein
VDDPDQTGEVSITLRVKFDLTLTPNFIFSEETDETSAAYSDQIEA